jgi:predicted Rossmann fold flavoprotein
MLIRFDYLVIGGGAAGFFAAVNAAVLAPEKRIGILEKSNKVLSKVRISGGGRCNVTHACFDNRELIKYYPRGGKELLGAFSRFNTSDTISWFNDRGVELYEQEDGRMFPITDDSATIASCLEEEAARLRVEIRMQQDVIRISKIETGFELKTQTGEIYQCEKLTVACGGFPKSASYEFLNEAGHRIVSPVPSLFTFNMPGNRVTQLMGVSTEMAHVRIEDTSIETEGPLLITHWGMSGPAILKASAWGARELAAKNYTFTARINWLPQTDAEMQIETARSQNSAKQLSNTVMPNLPKRLWHFLIEKSKIDPEMRWADLTKTQMQSLKTCLEADGYEVRGKTTFKEEFVTCGGIALDQVDFKTMQSRLVEGLFFAGEVLDLDGVTGGFNFQAAWTSGYLAAYGMAGIVLGKQK